MKLLIVDDHPVLREGLAALLSQMEPGVAVLQARDAEEGLAIVDSESDLDVVVLDLNMPGMSGMLAITEFGRRRPELPVVVLSSSEDPRDARKALALGALGYVPKSASQHALVAAVRLVLNGELYVPPLVLNREGAASASQNAPDGSAAARLTGRQIEVLVLLSAGQPNKVIARTLDLSEKTVKVHVTAIFKALNVVNRTQAATVGRASGLI